MKNQMINGKSVLVIALEQFFDILFLANDKNDSKNRTYSSYLNMKPFFFEVRLKPFMFQRKETGTSTLWYSEALSAIFMLKQGDIKLIEYENEELFNHELSVLLNEENK